MARLKSNIPVSPLRWPVVRAAEEFEIDQVTLRKRLVAAEQESGEDGCYSTSQITQSIFNSSKSLRDEEVRERTKSYRLKNEILEGNLMDLNEALQAIEDICKVIAQIIKGSHLSKKDQDDILRELARSPDVLENVAKKQSLKTAKED